MNGFAAQSDFSFDQEFRRRTVKSQASRNPFSRAKEAVVEWFRREAQLRDAIEHVKGRREKTQERVSLLNPNEFSDIKIERYVFSLNPSQFSSGTNLTWGKVNGWTAYKNPLVPFRAEKLFINAPCMGLVYVNTIQAANVSAQIGGIADGYNISRMSLSLPTLPPQNTMQVTGTWSAHVEPGRAGPKDAAPDHPWLARLPSALKPWAPPSWTGKKAEVGDQFVLCCDFEGWATVVA